MKLTGPQKELLVSAYEGRGHVVEYYPPAKKLVALGLCEWRTVGLSTFLSVTDAGRDALEASEEDG